MTPIPPLARVTRPAAKAAKPPAERITRELVEAVLPDGGYRVRGVALRTSSPSAQLRAGEEVAVYWRGERPMWILAHTARRAQPHPAIATVGGIVEEYFIAPISSGDARLDVWYRNEEQLTRLKVREKLGANPDTIRVNPSATGFLVTKSASGFLATSGEMNGAEYTKIYVFKLDREVGELYGSRTPSATLHHAETLRDSGVVVAAVDVTEGSHVRNVSVTLTYGIGAISSFSAVPSDLGSDDTTTITVAFNTDALPDFVGTGEFTNRWPGYLKVEDLYLNDAHDVLALATYRVWLLTNLSVTSEDRHSGLVNVTKGTVLWRSNRDGATQRTTWRVDTIGPGNLAPATGGANEESDDPTLSGSVSGSLFAATVSWHELSSRILTNSGDPLELSTDLFESTLETLLKATVMPWYQTTSYTVPAHYLFYNYGIFLTDGSGPPGVAGAILTLDTQSVRTTDRLVVWDVQAAYIQRAGTRPGLVLVQAAGYPITVTENPTTHVKTRALGVPTRVFLVRDLEAGTWRTVVPFTASVLADAGTLTGIVVSGRKKAALPIGRVDREAEAHHVLYRFTAAGATFEGTGTPLVAPGTRRLYDVDRASASVALATDIAAKLEAVKGLLLRTDYLYATHETDGRFFIRAWDWQTGAVQLEILNGTLREDAALTTVKELQKLAADVTPTDYVYTTVNDRDTLEPLGRYRSERTP